MRKSTHKQSRKQWVTVFSHTLSLRAAVQLGHCVCVWVYLCVCIGDRGGGAKTKSLVDISCYTQCLTLFINYWFNDLKELLLSAISVFHTFHHLSANTKWLCLNNTCCAFHTHDDVLDHPWSSSICTNWLLWAMPSTNAKVYNKRHISNLDSNEITALQSLQSSQRKDMDRELTFSLDRNLIFIIFQYSGWKMVQHFSNFDEVFRIFFLLWFACVTRVLLCMCFKPCVIPDERNDWNHEEILCVV